MFYDLAIIGAGAAGMSAAIYGARAKLKTIIFGDERKSNLYKAHVVTNYFGLPNSPTGPELLAAGLIQSMHFGAEHCRAEIVNIHIDETGSFVLKDSLQTIYVAKTVIIATGQNYVLAGIKGEKDYFGKGLSYCVTCDGAFFENKRVVVIGNGDYAAEEALQLAVYSSDVTLVSHGKDFSFNENFRRDLDAHGIGVLRTPRVAAIHGVDKVEKIVFVSPLANGEVELLVDGVFMAVGVAGAGFFAEKLGIEREGNYIKIDKNGYTNVASLFAAGDCTGSPAQVASSVGGGCNAALSAIKLVRGLSNYIQYN